MNPITNKLKRDGFFACVRQSQMNDRDHLFQFNSENRHNRSTTDKVVSFNPKYRESNRKQGKSNQRIK